MSIIDYMPICQDLIAVIASICAHLSRCLRFLDSTAMAQSKADCHVFLKWRMIAVYVCGMTKQLGTHLMPTIGILLIELIGPDPAPIA